MNEQKQALKRKKKKKALKRKKKSSEKKKEQYLKSESAEPSLDVRIHGLSQSKLSVPRNFKKLPKAT